MDKLKVTVQGVRDDGYTKKGETKRTERFLADVYLQGSGALAIPVSKDVYTALLSVKPGADALLPFQIQQQAEIRTAGERSFGIMKTGVRFGDLELVAASQPAKAS